MNNYFTVHRWVQLEQPNPGKTTHSVWPRRCISSQGITMLHGFIELSISPHQQSTKRDHPIGSCGLVCKIDVAQQILQINCSSLFHEGLHSMFSQSIQSWWCAWCWLQMVNSILFRKFFSCEYTSIVKPSWSCQTWSGCDQVTVACELHPLPCSSNSRSAYSVAYLHTAILHTQHLFLSIYGCLLDKNRTSFPNSGSWPQDNTSCKALC